MKPLLLLIFLTCFCLNIEAQTYFSITDSGSVWRYETQWGGEPHDHIYLELAKIKEDTFFNDHTYSILEVEKQTIYCDYSYFPPYENWIPKSTTKIHYYVREDSLKKTYFAYSHGEEHLLYDFNLNEGDSLPISYINPDYDNYVFSIDSILIGSEYRTRYNINNFGNLEPYVSIIEGIGSTYGLLYPLYPPFETYNQLICYSDIYGSTQFAEPISIVSIKDDDLDDCNLIFVDINNPELISEEIKIAPNPVNHTFSVIYTGQENEPGKLKILNLNSQVVFEKQIQLFPNVNITNDISDIPDGIYLVVLETESFKYLNKVIKR